MLIAKLTIAVFALAALVAPASAASVRQTNLQGSGNTTGTAATTIIAAQGVGVRMYINGVQCKNSGATSTIVTLNDSASSVLMASAAGGDNETFITPLVVAANTPLTFTPLAASTTVYCNAQGYTGS